ncbi:DUF2164 domain-containing protein [Ferrimonas lipolytica]|uniref:DUF2164 domain-containing protein n=1 Tax=Ferrimonas lipolytica TaxID=2724191 RepID=A0A6H1UGL4_9GAMM|nr:DUF2164 domain-containing protein [Ferrimonas lipolytica]QIZ78184.1 DUF2164 domain-containing protein [Ferrimonas lipolytica]
MPIVKFSREQEEALALKVQRYCSDEFDVDLGQFEAEFLLQFVVKQVEPEIYNHALEHCHKLAEQRLADLHDDLYQLEQTSAL